MKVFLTIDILKLCSKFQLEKDRLIIIKDLILSTDKFMLAKKYYIKKAFVKTVKIQKNNNNINRKIKY